MTDYFSLYFAKYASRRKTFKSKVVDIIIAIHIFVSPCGCTMTRSAQNAVRLVFMCRNGYRFTGLIKGKDNDVYVLR